MTQSRHISGRNYSQVYFRNVSHQSDHQLPENTKYDENPYIEFNTTLDEIDDIDELDDNFMVGDGKNIIQHDEYDGDSMNFYKYFSRNKSSEYFLTRKRSLTDVKAIKEFDWSIIRDSTETKGGVHENKNRRHSVPECDIRKDRLPLNLLASPRKNQLPNHLHRIQKQTTCTFSQALDDDQTSFFPRRRAFTRGATQKHLCFPRISLKLKVKATPKKEILS